MEVLASQGGLWVASRRVGGCGLEWFVGCAASTDYREVYIRIRNDIRDSWRLAKNAVPGDQDIPMKIQKQSGGDCGGMARPWTAGVLPSWLAGPKRWRTVQQGKESSLN